jgi:cytochrome P450
MITKDMKSKNQKMSNGEIEELEQRDHPTIFHELLQSDLPPQEKEVQRLGDEAQTILGAGLQATAWALTVAAFHILNNTNILKRLHHKLKEAIPGPHDELDWQRLEKLPYLTACIQEVLRFSYGVTARHPRVSSQATIQYKEWSIPPGTPASMSTIDIHHDEKIFPDSHKYIPERWLGNPQTLNRFLVSFGKDARSCLGIKYVISQKECNFR